MRWTWISGITVFQLVVDWLLRLYRDMVFAQWETQRISFLHGADVFLARGMFEAFYGPGALLLTGSLSTDVPLLRTVAYGCTVFVLAGSVFRHLPYGLLVLALGAKLFIAVFTAWIEPFLNIGDIFTGSLLDQMIALRPFFGAGPAPILSAVIGIPAMIASTFICFMARSAMKDRLMADRQ